MIKMVVTLKTEISFSQYYNRGREIPYVNFMSLFVIHILIQGLRFSTGSSPTFNPLISYCLKLRNISKISFANCVWLIGSLKRNEWFNVDY